MIVLDLEWNQPFGGRRMEEIIQIGAVRLAEPGGAVQDWFNMHVKPVIYPKLSPVARKLPESAQALTADVCFPEAYQAFLDWCGGDTLWAEWGAGSRRACRQRRLLEAASAAGHRLHRLAGSLRPDAGHRAGSPHGVGARGGILRSAADL